MAAALQAIPASADKRPALLVLNISFLPKHIRDGKADRQEAHIHIQLSLNCGRGSKLQRHDLSRCGFESRIDRRIFRSFPVNGSSSLLFEH